MHYRAANYLLFRQHARDVAVLDRGIVEVGVLHEGELQP